jgi:hypothetical protein
LKIRHHTLVVTTPGKVHWANAYFTFGIDYFDGIKIPETATPQRATAKFSNNCVKSVG